LIIKATCSASKMRSIQAFCLIPDSDNTFTLQNILSSLISLSLFIAIATIS
jgi:hypothetical protein